MHEEHRVSVSTGRLDDGLRRRRAGKPVLMPLAPGLEDIDDRPQALADLRQGVFHPRRHLGIDLADDQPVVLERPKLFGEHALGNPGHPPPQLTKALGAVLEMEEDDALPLAVDQVQRRFHCATRPVGKIPPFHGSFSNSIRTGTISLFSPYLQTWCWLDS